MPHTASAPGLESIATEHAPRALGPYSQAIATGDLIFCSGQVPLDPATGELVSGDIGRETKRVLANLQAVLEAAGASLSSVVKTTVFLTHLDDFAEMNAAYAECFGTHRPARATVEVRRLPLGARIEIDAIARRTAP